MHDKNVEESNSPAEGGSCSNWCFFWEITRGDILSNINHFTSVDQELIIRFEQLVVL